MIKNIVYEKPTMKFWDIRNQQNVADANCWSHASGSGQGKDDDWFYNYYDPKTESGGGYVEFTMGGNCNSVVGTVIKLINVPEGTTKDAIEQQLGDSAAKFSYNPDFFSPDEPGPGSWS